ncbi:MAG TPA: GNAT family N-acetyltransferase [Mycobacteriales bacterium]|nr:GNAT family N-acetyltransferase [Mycobacteriales bacterium]
MTIRPADLADPRVRQLLHLHLAGLQAITPPDNVYALDLTGLQAPGVTVWTVWDGETLLGCGALKELDATSGELKSMRTDPRHLRRGVATRLLEYLLALARSRGYRRVSLETGSGEAFEPALALYRRYGFSNGPAFGDYRASEFNQFLHLDL